MKKFEYKIVTSDGESLSGTMPAKNKDEVYKLLEPNISEGGFIVYVKNDFSLESLLSYQNKFVLNRKELYSFSSQLETLIKSGLTLLECLEILKSMMANKKLKTLCSGILSKVKSGETFSTALKDFPYVFNTQYIALVQAGELSGALAKTFEEIVALLEWEEALTTKIKKATRYPTFVIIFALLVSFGTFQYLVPLFAGFFQSAGAKLPLITRILLSISNFVRAFLPFIIAFFFLLGFSFGALKATKKGSLIIDTNMFYLPLIGTLNRRVMMARFMRIFSILYGQGISVVGSFRVCKTLSKNQFYRNEIEAFEDELIKGESIAKISETSELFKGLASQLLSTGEQGGSLQDLAQKGSQIFDRQVDNQIEALFTILEPLTIIVIALVVSTLIAGIFLPMIQMMTTIG